MSAAWMWTEPAPTELGRTVCLSPSQAGWLSRGLLLLLVSYLFFFGLADRDLWSSHEGRAAQNAQNILDDGAWLVPHLHDGRSELQKPPLYYWCVALLAWVRQSPVDAWAVRLPAACSALLTVFCVHEFLAKQGRLLAGFLSATCLASCVHFTFLARIGRTDMPLTFACTAGVLLLLTDTSWSRVLGYLALSAGVLCKGPIGLALPLAVLLPCWQHWRVRSLVWGVPLVLACTLPWFVWANHATAGQLWHEFFWVHNFQRGWGGETRLRAHPWWFYGPQLAVDLLPWSPFLVGLAYWTWSRRKLRDDRLAQLGLAWLLSMSLLLSCARFKRADYLLPAYPGAALFLGCSLETLYRSAARSARQILASGFALLLLGTVLGWGVWRHLVLPKQDASLEMHSFAQRLRTAAPTPNEIVFFRMEAHGLAHHVGRPLRVLVQWQELLDYLHATSAATVVMPVSVSSEVPTQLGEPMLVEVGRNTETNRRPPEKVFVFYRKRGELLVHHE